MPTAPSTRCLIPRCPNLAHRRGKCTDHYTPWEQASANTSALTRAEQARIRTASLRREPTCRHCGQPATDADHIRPIGNGGAARDMNNVQSLCSDCHDNKTRTEAAARNKQRTQQTR